MEQIYLTILIPAYNEENRLPESIRSIDAYCSKHLDQPYELLVVDDGSQDQTAALMREMQKQIPSLVLHQNTENRGKGYALRAGMHLAGGQFIVFTDSDLSTPIEEIQPMLERLKEGTPIVIATRKKTGARLVQRQPFWRESMGKIFTLLSNVILGLSISDFTCGFKGFEAKAGKHIFSLQKIRRWAFDSEVLFLAKQFGYRIVEIPVQWKDSPESKVRVIQDSVSSFASLFLIRWNWSTGKYKKATN